MTGHIATLAVAIAAACAAIGDALIVSSFINSAARQPEMEGRLFSRMIVGIAFVEGTFFIALAMAFILK